MSHLTPEEILSVLKTAKGRSIRDWAMILVAFKHGLRASEVCNLKTGGALMWFLRSPERIPPLRPNPLAIPVSILLAPVRQFQG